MKKVLLLSLLSVLLWATVPVQALTAPALTVVEVGCDPLPILEITATATWSNDDSGGFDTGAIRIYDGDGDWVNSDGGYLWSGGIASITRRMGGAGAQFAQEADHNPLRIIFSDSISGADVDLVEVLFNSSCLGAAESSSVNVETGALSFPAGGVYVYATATDTGVGLSLWGTDAEGDGYLVASLTGVELETLLADLPAENTLLATGSSLYGEINVYLLTTGEFQVNVGADAEGWVRVMIFSAFPVANVSYDSFNVLA